MSKGGSVLALLPSPFLGSRDPRGYVDNSVDKLCNSLVNISFGISFDDSSPSLRALFGLRCFFGKSNGQADRWLANGYRDAP